ncbi:MAG: CoA-binding protein, partial [Salaquimonas sp.]|nr:CoA-binding protein [Salaquimonas sp.]
AGGEICGVPVAVGLREIDRPIDMVDIFRNSQAAAGVVDEALKLSPLPMVIWMQLGVRNDAAAALAEAAGIRVVMNRCPKIEYARLCGEIGWAGVRSGVISSKKPSMQTGFQRFGIVARKD